MMARPDPLTTAPSGGIRIANLVLPGRALLAPMAGVSDAPFRGLCTRYGAALATSEMFTSDPRLQSSDIAQRRLRSEHSNGLKSIQIVGADAGQMAEAARIAVSAGAQLVDINMGCPAKKVCARAAGSALLRDEHLVAEILRAVTAAVPVPVTLKMRTGWCPDSRNGVTIARLAEDIGIQALAVHGRTRACKYGGTAEYDTIAAIKAAVTIPVIANGDIDGAEKARQVLDYTGADGVMVGRAAQGRPWIFTQINAALANQPAPPPPPPPVLATLIEQHLVALEHLYGTQAVRIARKHVHSYLDPFVEWRNHRADFNRFDSTAAQCSAVGQFLNALPLARGTAA